jgi:aspartyl-tRNA(Asn)/glutamyl-tRNA(Gln) amidotransferase subunit A
MSKLHKLTIKKIIDNKLNIREIWNEMKSLYEQYKHLNILIESYFDEVPEEGKIPIAIKDNYHISGKKTTCASKMMKNFVAPVTATMVKRCGEFCSFIGKANMDSYAMGSTGKTSDFGPTLSPWKSHEGLPMSPGGSSSGSAAAVALGICLAALGSETGGSVRTPAMMCGLVGLKPTYGVLSRYGIVELVSEYDVPGILTKTVEDCEWMFNKLHGTDDNDFTCVEYKPVKFNKNNFGIFENIGESAETRVILEKCTQALRNAGLQGNKSAYPSIFDYAVQTYTITNFVSVASNLARFNGILYGDEDKHNTRSRCFSQEIQRRTVLGNYIAYENNIHHYYTKAQKVINEIHLAAEKLFSEYDFILLPISPDRGLTFEESLNPDPITMYELDKYADWSCVAGYPGLTIPITLHSEYKTPMAIQIVGPYMSDSELLRIGKIIDECFNFNEKHHWTDNANLNGGK